MARVLAVLTLLFAVACANGRLAGDRDAGSVDDAIGDSIVDDAHGNTIDASDAAALTPPADPFVVDTSCTPMTFADLVPRFSEGETEVSLSGPFVITTRSRNACNTVTGCTPWMPGGVQLADYWAPTTQIYDLAMAGTSEGLHLRFTGAVPPTPYIAFSIVTNAPEPLRLQCMSITPTFDGGAPTCELRVVATDGSPMFIGTLPGNDYLGVVWKGRLCSDGRYQFVTKVADDMYMPTESTTNRRQIAIYGQL